MPRIIEAQHPAVMAVGRLLLRRPWLVFIVGAVTVFLLEIGEHWQQPIVFDRHFFIELVVYGLGGPLLVWLLLRWLARTLVIDMPTKRVQSDASLAERQRIARDLHDKLAQNLAYLHFKLDQLHATNNATLSEIVSIQDELAHMRQVADDAYEQVRATLNNLRGEDTAIPVNLQLELQEYAEDILHRADMVTDVSCSVSDTEICQITKRTALNIAQEAICNVAKHAHASHVRIELVAVQNDTVLTITDNGNGLATGQKTKNGHYGLEIMRERAEEIGGQLNITVVPSGGTQVKARFPNTVISESLLQTCERLACNHLPLCRQILARQPEAQPAPASGLANSPASNFGRADENPSG